MTLTWLDIAFIVLPMSLVVGITWYMKRFMSSVSDYLVSGRVAGRYLICVSHAELGGGLMAMVAMLEMFGKVGFSPQLWLGFIGLVWFMMNLFAVVSYRFRQTRCMTFHQFLEIRYSKSLRVTGTALQVLSGLINFGIIPGVGARFFVYYLQLPDTIPLGDLAMPTFWPIMAVLMGASLYFTLAGGQMSVMVTDATEGVISGIFYLIIGFTLFFILQKHVMGEALMSGPPGQSYINPFDIGGHQDFGGWFIIISLLLGFYTFRGAAWNASMVASAKTAHEGRMAGILGIWRGQAAGALITLVCAGAFTVLHHDLFVAEQAEIARRLAGLTPQLADQQRMPAALSELLPMGVKGMFCAVLLMGLFNAQSAILHGTGSNIVQDIIIPLRKKGFSQATQIKLLRWGAVFVAVFTFCFSMVYKPADYLIMITAIVGAIYLGGMGAIIWGGLYWSRATRQGAWAAMATGAVLATTFFLLQSFWTSLQPTLVAWCGTTSSLGAWIAEHPTKCPINGQILTLIVYTICGGLFIGVSLLTSRTAYNMDKMLHRGAYAVDDEEGRSLSSDEMKGWSWDRLIGATRNFTRGDRWIAGGTFCWAIFWNLVNLGLVLWCLGVNPLPDQFWWDYKYIIGVCLPLLIGTITTVWFTIGAYRDFTELITTLKTTDRSHSQEDGRVAEDGSIVGDATPPAVR